ncbi:serine/threonine-protein kinase [Spirillospora sp. NPDC029432]|uniref:serine/threonine-protein kinase n=1 Tax=Spirillospora sp. NPDC029432 TaxID=3154599 RepID=UPI00345548F5
MDPLRPADPRMIGRYTLTGRLGAGGMGQVYHGHSPGGRPVAVKLIRAEYGADAQFRRRFAREVEAAKRVGGFYTAQVVDADPDAETPWLVTAYVPGPSLLDAVNEHGPLPPDAVRTLGAALVEGLIAVHDCNLVHRDLKPGNVIMGPDGPRLIDFGIARALDATSTTVTRGVLGTPAYMSPEQARGDSAGPPSDVFSLGSVLAFAATGAAPFGHDSLASIVYRVVHGEPDLGAVPAELRPLIARCLEKNPAGRPSTHQLLAMLAPPPAGSATPPPAPPRTERPERPATLPVDVPTTPPRRPDPPRPEPDSAEPAATWRVSGRRQLWHVDSLLFLALIWAVPGTIAAANILGGPIPTGLWVLAAVLGGLGLLVLWALSLTNEELVIDQQGIARRMGEKGAYLPWDEIERLTFRDHRPGRPRWRSHEYVAAVPKQAPPPEDKIRKELRWRKTTGDFRMIDMALLPGRPHHEIAAAVARFSSGRLALEVPGRPQDPGIKAG